MMCFIPYFSSTSLILFSVIIGSVLLYKNTSLSFLNYLRFPFLICSILIIYNEYGTWRGFEPASILFSTLVLLKIFELKTKRDIHSLILIQFLHVISLSLLVEDFYYLFIIFISLVICFSNLYLVEQVSIDKNLFKNSFKRVFKFAAIGAPLVVILFLIFPRFNFGGFLFSSNTASTGFSEDLKPGDIAEIIKDPTPVFHVKFTRKISRPDLYWRGQILAKNENFNWSKTKLPERRVNETLYKKYDYFINYDILSSGPLFTLEKTRKVVLSSLGSLINLKGNLYFSNPIMKQKSRYKGWLGPALPAKLLKGYESTYLQADIPKDSKVAAFVEENNSLQNRPMAVAKFLKRFFRKNFYYTTAPGVYSGKNSLDEFLFKRRIGFCGHFASASATLFRLFGIPARVVIGYQGGQYNDVGDFYLITKKDAHTWVEYLSTSGVWTRFDAVSVVSPERVLYGADAYFEFEKFRSNGKGIEEFISSKSGVMAEWRQYLQNIYYTTGTLFFNYDLEAQRNLFKSIVSIKLKDTSFYFYLRYIALFFTLMTILAKREFIKSFMLYLCICKFRAMKWSEFKVTSESQLIKSIALRSENLAHLILMYESLRYSRVGSIRNELSFLFRAIKILIYG